jgi:hypothetical protein
MIARHRGDTRAHSRWRPSAPAAAPPAPAEPEELLEQHPRQLLDERQPLGPAYTPRRRSRALIAVATVVVVAVIAAQQHTGRAPATPGLPSTPTQWVEQWTAASLENPARVCDQLFAPALAAAFKPDTGHTCAWYYTSVKSTSFRMRHVLQDGGTATVEAQEVGTRRKWGYFTVVLSHLHGGWQAVDIVPGGPVRAR